MSDDSSSLVGAASWLRDVLLGPAATLIAVLAIAALGLAMLAGRLPVRRGATAVLGCFILFSAGLIADALIGASPPTRTADAPVAAPSPAYRPTAPKPQAYDPYAGAAVPNQAPEQPLIH